MRNFRYSVHIDHSGHIRRYGYKTFSFEDEPEPSQEEIKELPLVSVEVVRLESALFGFSPLC